MPCMWNPRTGWVYPIEVEVPPNKEWIVPDLPSLSIKRYIERNSNETPMTNGRRIAEKSRKENSAKVTWSSSTTDGKEESHSCRHLLERPEIHSCKYQSRRHCQHIGRGVLEETLAERRKALTKTPRRFLKTPRRFKQNAVTFKKNAVILLKKA